MPYNIAGIDVHKRLLVVVVADAAEPDVILQSRRFGTGSAELHNLALWLGDLGVQETVMESTAQYWKPVWMELEPQMPLRLAQARSNRAPKGRKSDLADAKRLLRRFVAGELLLSFVPDAEQRGWRTVTRARLQLVRERVQLQNQVESLLEEGRIKLSAVISDLLGVSGRRILRAIANGETDPEKLAALGDQHLKCGRAVLVDALTGSMHEIHRTLLRQHLDRIELLDKQVEELNKSCAALMQANQEAVMRLIEVPGIGAEAAQRSLPRSDRLPSPFPRRRNWLPGSESARVPTRAPIRITPGVPPKATASCAACSVKPRRPRSKLKEAICNPCFNASSSAWDIPKRSGRSRTGCAESPGRFCTSENGLSSTVRPSTPKPSNAASITT